MKSVLMVLGTRPEAIKLGPLYREFKRRSDRLRLVCALTGQHRELIDPFLRFFEIRPDHDLNIFKENQGLFHITAAVLQGMQGILLRERPDLVIVQGDTTSAFAAALSAFYLRIPVGHVEAGLRSYDRFQPYPEEVNRACISHVTDLHFCPTQRAADNLLAERIRRDSVFVTGNTVIDALLHTSRYLDGLSGGALDLPGFNPTAYRMILVTAHRRESFGEGVQNLSLALLEIAEAHSDVLIVYSVHPNPNVRGPVEKLLGSHPRIRIIPPPDYLKFVRLMKEAFFIITDSGGIQEEAPSLHKPVLVARNLTERPEAVECGAARIVGTDQRVVVEEATRLLEDPAHYGSMVVHENPFGDGRASIRIADIVEAFLRGKRP
ncbi:MAG: UDP-N-acetylglucosamine 2-epimerase (non-hydrolyzing) [Thermodesulfobacteriota bacterium]